MPNTFDQSLRDDIRFLGTILGDTLKEKEGKATFDLIENIRRLIDRVSAGCRSAGRKIVR